MRNLKILVISAAALAGVAASAHAQSDSEALAKAAQNPVANMISIPFLNKTNLDVGDRPW